MHPPRMSAPSCIIPPLEQLVIRPHIVPLLPNFHGMESENPYAHIKEFEEDKAKIWLNSLRPRSIRNWVDLQAEFLKKFFPTHRTNGLKRQISNFSAKENEKFHECWERYMEAINACPHHGFDTWLLNPEEAMDFLSYVSEVSRGWDEPNSREKGKFPSQPTQNPKGGMYVLSEDMDMKAKVATIARRLEELELKKMHEVQAISETKPMSCHAPFANHVIMWPNNNAPYGNTYNSSWRNHPNFSWKPRPPPYQPQAQTQAPQQTSSVEQAIVNLSKVMGDFVGEQKAINSQLHQKIENVESSQIKRMEGMQNDLSQKIDNIQYSISRLTNLNTVNEKGKFPSQPSQNPKGVHEVETQEGESSKLREVRQDEELMSKKTLVKESNNQEEKSGKKSASKSSIEEEPRIVIKEDMMKKHMPPPFPQALHGKKEIKNSSEILEVLRQVKVNIPLLDMIKQVPTYAKFLKDLCTVKRGLHVTKNAFLTEQVSAIIQSKSPVKYKDPGCPTISVNIGGTHVEKALLDLGASVNLLPYSVYKQLGLGGLKPTAITLSLADRHLHPEEEEGLEEVCLINTLVEEHCDKNLEESLNESLEMFEEGLPEPSDVLAIMSPWRRREEILPLFKGRLTRSNCGGPSKALVVSSTLTSDQEDSLLGVLRKCKKAIGWQISDLKGISPLVCTHHIYMEDDAKPVRQPQRRQFVGEPHPSSPKEIWNTVVQNEKGEEVSTRPTSGWRVCIDYRRLNSVTRKDHFPLPFMDQVLERVSGHPFYCFLDGYSGYFQIEIDLEDQEKTTFTCPFGTFAYRRMPFGLCNAPATFQRCMLSIFSDMVERIMEVFMDDITVYGSSYEECLLHLEAVLQRCIEKDLVLNWEKCHFMVQQGIVLGHIISKNGIEVDKAKVELIVKLPPPTNVKGIRQFLRTCRCQKSFEELKQFLTTAPIVRAPNWKLPFEVMCDASDLAMGAVLGQREDGKPYVIYYASKTLNEAQRNYTTTEKELLAVVFALDKFRAIW
ncbi:Retrovirus-related Pol polyprotein from transposon 17.6 [Vitis vinifera]|uniref:Retrovirus-related Pol polyprotein from transposon 17.6 n=1 Tax=Vitis vinifera TaxID=29760 RepID=A0A438FPH9_VITVI|nr:Retrovirus-related Pol polyprotein from transposon 17.6 [Vitis vinifera]